MAGTIQQTLDTTGKFVIPVGETFLDAPMFLDSDMRIVGDGPKSKLNAYAHGPPIIIGWRRGLVSDAHFPVGGQFRTLGDTFLYINGCEWDMGPYAGGWPSVSRFKLEVDIEKMDGGSWANVPIGGMNDGFLGYAAHPSPWVCYCSGGFVILSLKTTDGVIHTYTQAISDANQRIAFTFDIDLGLGRLAYNSTTPFGIGRCPPIGNATGYFLAEGALRDLTIHTFQVTVNGSVLGFLASGRPATYDGGPSLPLCSAWTSGGGAYMLMMHSSQGVPDSSNGNLLQDFYIQGAQAVPVIQTGAILGGGGTRLNGMRIVGGSRALCNTGLAVTYPITISDCLFQSQSDCGYWLYHASGVNIENTHIDYSLRCAGETISCVVWIRGDTEIAPPTPAQDCLFRQYGGNCRYDRIIADYEYTPGPVAFIRLVPGDRGDSGAFPTLCAAHDCSLGVAEGPIVRIETPDAGYVRRIDVTTTQSGLDTTGTQVVDTNPDQAGNYRRKTKRFKKVGSPS